MISAPKISSTDMPPTDIPSASYCMVCTEPSYRTVAYPGTACATVLEADSAVTASADKITMADNSAHR